MSKSNHSKWVPLSYPTSCIFSTKSNNKSSARRPNRYYPLHPDVLCAAVREIFLIAGLIDARTLKLRHQLLASVVIESELDSYNGKNHGVDIVPPQDDTSDRFDCTQDLVEFIVRQAVEKRTSADAVDTNRQVDGDQITEVDKEVSSCESTFIQSSCGSEMNLKESVPSKRKVSDVDETDDYVAKRPCCKDSFPSHVVQLVRSNIVILPRPSASSDEQKTTTPHSLSDDKIEDFLHHPKSSNQNEDLLYALPCLLKVDITTEANLRNISRTMVQSMLQSYNLDYSLGIFLGYKSTKSVNRNKLFEILADVLFDVSHAMYAWIQTEKELKMTAVKKQGESQEKSKKGKRIAIPTTEQHPADLDAIIRDSLFDERALKLIGGFEPSSLLPLALDVRYCRHNHMSWEDYMSTMKGRMAMELHLQCGVENDATARKRSYNEDLIEVGKLRRGKRGRAVRGEKSC